MKISKIKQDKRGFTLVEMVIVITIIGIVSSIGVTKYSKVQENAKKNADYATAANLATAAMMSLMDNNNSIQPKSLEANGYIQFEPIPKSVKKAKFNIVSEGDYVIVMIGQEQIYPKSVGSE